LRRIRPFRHLTGHLELIYLYIVISSQFTVVSFQFAKHFSPLSPFAPSKAARVYGFSYQKPQSARNATFAEQKATMESSSPFVAHSQFRPYPPTPAPFLPLWQCLPFPQTGPTAILTGRITTFSSPFIAASPPSCKSAVFLLWHEKCCTYVQKPISCHFWHPASWDRFPTCRKRPI
jgi:hypothetical protein